MRRLLAISASLVLSSWSAQAGNWTVDRDKSRLGFTVLWSGEPFAATFHAWTADIAFDSADLGHSHIVANIDLASEGSDTPDNDDGLKGPQGFWVERFRFARFETTKITGVGSNKYLAKGILSLHGFKQTIALPFVLTVIGNSAHAVARTRLLRSDFGLGTGEWAADTPIAHQVSVSLDLTAIRHPDGGPLRR